MKTAGGNAGLQALLFRLAIHARHECEDALQQTANHFATGAQPDHADLVAFVEKLALDKLWSLLSTGEQQLLRASTLFHLPVPITILESLAAALGISPAACERLLSQGVWERLPDPFRQTASGSTTAAQANALLAARCEELSDNDQQSFATVVTADLFEHWGGVTGGKQRVYPLDIELCRLAVLAGNADVAAAVGTDALAGLTNLFHYVPGAKLGQRVLSLLDSAGIAAPIDLLRRTGDLCAQTGDTATARKCYATAVTRIDDQPPSDETEAEDFAVLLVSHARQLSQDGALDQAPPLFEQASTLLAADRFARERAIVLGDIARIKVSRGDVDAALQLHEEMLRVFEGLGDQRSRAVTLGDIANIRAARGEFEESIRLHEVELTVYEAIGDRHSKAVTLYELAQIDLQRDNHQSAFERLAESYGINRQLGRLDGICFVGLDLGQLLCAAGQQEQGLEILTRSRDGFDKLGQPDHVRHTTAMIEQIRQA